MSSPWIRTFCKGIINRSNEKSWIIKVRSYRRSLSYTLVKYRLLGLLIKLIQLVRHRTRRCNCKSGCKFANSDVVFDALGRGIRGELWLEPTVVCTTRAVIRGRIVMARYYTAGCRGRTAISRPTESSRWWTGMSVLYIQRAFEPLQIYIGIYGAAVAPQIHQSMRAANNCAPQSRVARVSALWILDPG